MRPTAVRLTPYFMAIRFHPNIWAKDPKLRLDVRMVDQRLQYRLKLDLTQRCPVQPWPYGMPTTVNPWLVIVGISPGAGNHTPAEIRERRKDYVPCCGDPHRNFNLGGSWKGYWPKIRELCTLLLAEELDSDWNALSVCGHLNLGEGQSGTGNRNAIDPKLLRWIPDVVSKQLRPEVVILLGMKKLREDGELDPWKGGPLGFVVEDEPRVEPFRISRGKKKVCFRMWENPQRGYPNRVIMLPNHPSRPPMTNPKQRALLIHQLKPLVFR